MDKINNLYDYLVIETNIYQVFNKNINDSNKYDIYLEVQQYKEHAIHIADRYKVSHTSINNRALLLLIAIKNETSASTRNYDCNYNIGRLKLTYDSKILRRCDDTTIAILEFLSIFVKIRELRLNNSYISDCSVTSIINIVDRSNVKKLDLFNSKLSCCAIKNIVENLSRLDILMVDKKNLNIDWIVTVINTNNKKVYSIVTNILIFCSPSINIKSIM
jgi:hypothetical protein